TWRNVQLSWLTCSWSSPMSRLVSRSPYTWSPRLVTARTKWTSARLPEAANVAMPLAWSTTVIGYWPMPTSVGKCWTTSRPGLPRSSIRTGSVQPGWLVHIESTPALLAISMTLVGPSFSVRSKNVTFSEATVASHSAQSGWHLALSALRIGPSELPLTRPLA